MTEFTEVLEMIATNLGIAAERIFGVFVSAQPLIGIIEFCGMIVTLGMAYRAGRYVRKLCVRMDIDAYDEAAYPIVAGAAMFIFALIITTLIGDAVIKIVCPEYTAMRQLILLMR